MGIPGIALLVTGIVALALGAILGWTIGRRLQTFDNLKDIERGRAYRENAQVDFDFVRGKADAIVGLANDIAMRAKSAHDTVLPPHASMREPPGLGGEAGESFVRREQG